MTKPGTARRSKQAGAVRRTGRGASAVQLKRDQYNSGSKASSGQRTQYKAGQYSKPGQYNPPRHGGVGFRRDF
jgi:hypothetical protein